MLNTKHVSTVILGGSLFLAASAFAEADAEHIKNLENKIETIESQLSQMASGMDHHPGNVTGLPLHGFADVGFASNSDSNLAENPKGFFQGSLSFYLTPSFGDRVKALIEPNFETTPAGEVAVDLERVQFAYSFSDAATVWGGRIHTPYGYWNTGFHHGGQMQTSVLRPRFLDFEDKGGILPAHLVGLLGTGKVKASAGVITYDIYAGNGPKIGDVVASPSSQEGVLNPNAAGDDNHNALLGANVGYEFSGSMDGLRLAGHGFQGNVKSYDATPTLVHSTNLIMLGGSAVYLANDWEALGEYYGFNNTDSGTGSHKSWAAYLQIGKSLNDWTPYMRLERAALNQQDNYFRSQLSGQSYARQSLGLRYNLNQNAALKLELLNSNFMGEVDRTAVNYRSVFAQYAIGF